MSKPRDSKTAAVWAFPTWWVTMNSGVCGLHPLDSVNFFQARLATEIPACRSSSESVCMMSPSPSVSPSHNSLWEVSVTQAVDPSSGAFSSIKSRLAIDHATALARSSVGKVRFDLSPIQVAVVEKIDRSVNERFAVFSGHYDCSVNLTGFDHAGSQSHGVYKSEAGIGDA